jgi:hypothetical protein
MKKMLSLCIIGVLAFPSYSLANEFTPCCADHAEIVKVWMDSLHDLVARVRAENEEQFYRKSHKPEAVTNLQFIVQTTGEGLDHYNEMIAKSDATIVNMDVFKRSRKAVEGVRQKAGQYLERLKAAGTTDKESKAIVEGIILELKI